MTLDELVRAAAQDLAERAPDGAVDIEHIRTRAQRVRVGRRAGVAAGLAVAAVLVAVGLQAFDRSTAEPEPVEPPVPSPSIASDELGEYEDLATVTNAQPGNEDLTELTFEVEVADVYAVESALFCSGDPDTWYVVVIGDRGASGYGYCDNQVPEPFPAFPDDISPFGHSGGASGTVRVRMFVTGPIPQQHLDCFARLSPPECQDIEPPLEPLESTDVIFGVSVYEYWAPAVAEVAGENVGARASVDGVDYVLSQVVSSDPGEPELTTTVPADSGGHLVAALSDFTATAIACANAAKSREEEQACLPVLELRMGDRTVLLERGEFGDFPKLGYTTHGLFRVPPGAERRIQVRVASGRPRGIEFGLVVFEERP